MREKDIQIAPFIFPQFKVTPRLLLKPGFHMIVGDRSLSLGSLVNCSAIVTIIWKPNFHFASDRQRFQQLPTIATITIAGIESESISAIVAIVSDRKKLMEPTSAATAAIVTIVRQRSYGNHSTAIATIVTITAIVCVLRSERSQRLYGTQTSSIVTIAAIECFQRS